MFRDEKGEHLKNILWTTLKVAWGIELFLNANCLKNLFHESITFLNVSSAITLYDGYEKERENFRNIAQYKYELSNHNLIL
jgi:hypothetical protein